VIHPEPIVEGGSVPATSSRSEYSIAGVSKLTGVSCHALRVWERRYGYPIPHRSVSGHRRYSPEQVQSLRRMAQLMRQGHSIGDLIADLRAGRIELDHVAEAMTESGGTAWASGLVDQLYTGDFSGAEAYYEQLAERLGPAELISRLIEPALIDTGERWFRRECEVCQERCATTFLRRKLESLFDSAQRANTAPHHTALVGTVQGDRHEGGVLMLGLMLELVGWRALVLGSDLPVREYQKAIGMWRPDALCLSFVLSRNINKRFHELENIRELPIFVGGRSILNYQGLARRHGLIPLAGPAAQSIPQFLAHFEEWTRRNPPKSTRI
jgi:MerR family transcriptional regulator, light-induced transcriptional regulator